jgi:hypothetical protein
MPKAEVTIKIENVPEALAVMRRELAQMVRRTAGGEANPDVARRLRQIANAYEVGMNRLEP